MSGKSDALSPPKRLAAAYAPKGQRAFFETMLTLDARLAKVALADGETVISQMKMAWWRDVIAKPAENRPLGEPLISDLNNAEASVDAATIKKAAENLIDGWDCLLAAEEWDLDLLLKHSEYRAKAVFSDHLGNVDDVISVLGQQWALHDLAIQTGE